VACLVPVHWVAITYLKSGDNRDKTAGFSPSSTMRRRRSPDDQSGYP
jgi:hypothetical protein